MRIPWTPLEQGGGVKPPTLAERIFVGANGQPDYGTAKNPVERKAFQNLPMPTRDAMNIYEPNLHKGPAKGARGMIGSGLRHNHPEGAGENYVDSFVTHPVAGNYEKLFAGLEEQKKEAALERVPQLTLEMVARRGFTNMGLNADEERMNSLRDRLRFMGASDEEIETQLKETRQKKLREMVGREMIPEQRELHAADAWARQMGVQPEQGAFNFGARPFHDANVFNFGTPAPSHYAGFQSREGPDNGEFVPGGARGHGVHSIEVLPSDAERVARGRAGGKPQVQGVPDRTAEAQLALVRQGPELVGRNAAQMRSQIRFIESMRRVYSSNVDQLLSKKAEALGKLQDFSLKYPAKRYLQKKVEKADEEMNRLEQTMSKIEQGAMVSFQPIRGRGRPKRR
jgi:hypothetical protein